MEDEDGNADTNASEIAKRARLRERISIDTWEVKLRETGLMLRFCDTSIVLCAACLFDTTLRQA